MTFIDPRTDFAFKRIFASAESKPILISFLNGLIYQGNPTIQDLQMIDPYQAGEVVGLKDSYLDVKATLDNGTIVIIEMQVLNVKAFEKRIAYNAAKAYGNQLTRGKGYFSLDPVIAITITDFILFENTNKIISRFSFKEEEEHFDYICPTMTLIFVELPKFNKSVDELESLADKWIYFIREAPNLEMVPESLETTAPIQQAFGIANTVNLSRKELDQLEAQVFYLQDQQRSIEEALETGAQRGQINTVIRLLERKLETLDESIKSRIAQLSSDRIDTLTEAVLDFNSAEDLVSWLQEMGDR
ncbi:MAG: Rpn family recombination-promoting nuclease/putative transposase [Microcoleus sp. PH2017_29_MFU_D_A]|uniref:Rpn family recombination-promoting nuclease/putative transposase n=1 Tax=unclassified Microcoleus TaxID=2642155 RepID=UPI001D80B7CB|nr:MULTISPECIES: Rpn family recombination-promoting nuclease/putative transposase [unclassified Microcoleus]MCC3417208.1 Rpn family recombination-promoting nuclease/putative transposase [Microcoleus sp. PH2017_07_MST_O_A]MCC3432785.1 Rpn family recombination-promoting nuclease/putative transposase [Microcoleus sp. PH2017_04_SCI_O_A]MCC3440423.1 Rpn family recombination-promoting nuclease/putative transposase [Microcoleus sp. PH2017_03_ELD_O_A]MCC3501677.1 Rpn family recombination-promoting nucl